MIAGEMTIASALAARRSRSRAVLVALGAFVLCVALVSAGTGAVAISPTEVVAIVVERLGVHAPWDYDARQADVLLAIRLPRLLLGLLVGAALAVSGGVMQGLFRNPLADPGLVGISSGGVLAAVASIVVGPTLLGSLSESLGPWLLPIAAFGGSMAATFVVYRLSGRGGGISVPTMLLAGIAINALAGGVTGIFTFTASDAQLRNITFWTLGSLGGATWKTLAAVAPLLGLALILLPRLASNLNTFLLGEAEAGHLGTDVDRVKRQAIVLVALCVGASVAVTGIIGFVGLVTPHLLRLLIGPDHRTLLPGSAMLGGALLLGADLVARTVAVPAELPIGIVTAMLGAPFFLWLLARDTAKLRIAGGTA